jgi:hypothetical protein
MEYQLILILGNGNYLFRSEGYVIYGTKEKYRNIRVRFVNLVINNWEMYKTLVVGDLSYKLPIYNYNDYEH